MRGARTHNLKGVDLRIPRGAIVAFTGVSGSGKTSLAFDTIFAEGQRRYLETTSPSLRAVLDQLPAPDVDSVTGLPPTLSVEQHASASAGPRSTVATVSELHDYFRILYAQRGTPFCPNCGTRIEVRTADQIADEIMTLPEGEKIHLLAPIVRGAVGDLREELLRIKREAFVRIRLDGVLGLADAGLEIDPTKPHDLDMVVDRQVVRDGSRERILESVALTLKHGDGTITVATLDSEFNWIDRTFSSKFACPKCHATFAELEPRTFNFNSPHGACPECAGMGVVGDTTEETEPEAQARADARTSICPTCQGDRLGPAGRSVKLGGRTLPETLRMTIGETGEFFKTFDAAEEIFADANLGPVLANIQTRLGFLDRVGVGYLQLDRPTRTLSGGEAQRVRLAGCVGAALRGVCYVLDEPTLGLHSRDVGRLMDVLETLRDSGASVLMVEHDDDALRRADWLVDVGPGAGSLGGRIVNAGAKAEFLNGEGLTAEYLNGRRTVSLIEPEARAREKSPKQWLELSGVTHRNLKNVTLRIPINRLTAVSGVSGSGKSSLVAEALAPAMQRHLGQAGPEPGAFAVLNGAEAFTKVVVVDQSPIGRSPKSTPATFLGILDELRHVFAQTKEAKARGYTAARFTFNAKAGQCSSCKGMGVHRVEVKLLGEQWAICGECRGSRFNSDALAVRFRGLNIAEALAMTVAEAAEFFQNHPKVARRLAMLSDLGLGYLRLDQWATTLSGGEAQRLKLAVDLLREDVGATLFLLDEPTSGLHSHDVGQLLGALRKLVAAGHTVVAVEHHLDFIASCDWAVDLGPEGGDAGGRIIAEGAPSSLRDVPESATGYALAAKLQRSAKAKA